MKNSFFGRSRLILLTALACALTPLAVLGQGNDNPTGATGAFSGNSTTGCSYNPYTANAQRIIPDLAVAGAVGAYPLQWARIMNSRQAGGGVFGQGGGWGHSYQWSCSATENATSAPASYTINYPDGRKVTFAANVGTPYLAPVGVTDRMGGAPGDSYVYLTLTDGGKVRFWQDATYHPSIAGEPAWWDFVIGPAEQIIDPHGNITQLFYTSGKLTKVQEAGGRYAHFLRGEWLRIRG